MATVDDILSADMEEQVNPMEGFAPLSSEVEVLVEKTKMLKELRVGLENSDTVDHKTAEHIESVLTNGLSMGLESFTSIPSRTNKEPLIKEIKAEEKDIWNSISEKISKLTAFITELNKRHSGEIRYPVKTPSVPLVFNNSAGNRVVMTNTHLANMYSMQFDAAATKESVLDARIVSGSDRVAVALYVALGSFDTEDHVVKTIEDMAATLVEVTPHRETMWLTSPMQASTVAGYYLRDSLINITCCDIVPPSAVYHVASWVNSTYMDPIMTRLTGFINDTYLSNGGLETYNEENVIKVSMACAIVRRYMNIKERFQEAVKEALK